MAAQKEQLNCYHCGDACKDQTVIYDTKNFCCHGCKTVYSIFKENNLENYYSIQQAAGATPKEITTEYEYLDHQDIKEKLLSFSSEGTEIVNLYIPHIHCSSCIWVLENLNKLSKNILSSLVDFPNKKVTINYKSDQISLKEVVLLLASIGYEPYISLADYNKEASKVDRTIYYKLGVAGFAFGNVMFLSFPEYFNYNDIWIEEYKHFFRGLMLFFSLPVVFYAASDYFKKAYQGIRSKFLNIDVPIALGISVLFIRSTVEVLLDWGPGFFDSLTGLVFFLLIGKYFQDKTYKHLSFERDFNSYFPIAVTLIEEDEKERIIPIHELEEGKRILIRNGEIIPTDGRLLKGEAEIDYAYVTGESKAVTKFIGDRIYAGGRQLSGAIELLTTKSVSQSYLTQLWSNESFDPLAQGQYQNLTDRISKHFTIVILSIAITSSLIWYFIDATQSLQVLTAVLIVACPCALALAAPFTQGNLLRIFGTHKFYIKDGITLEKLAQTDAVVLDKTGTLSAAKDMEYHYVGTSLTAREKVFITSTLRASHHPLSRSLYELMDKEELLQPKDFENVVGQGIKAHYDGIEIRLGNSEFTNNKEQISTHETSVFCSINGINKGRFVFKTTYRKGLKELLIRLSQFASIHILTGDNEGEKSNLEALCPKTNRMLFKQQPQDKLNYVKNLKKQGRSVVMVGDGLNDAGALKESTVGIAITEDIAVFTPASDAILDATVFEKLEQFIAISKRGIKVIRLSLVISLFYNLIGISIAVMGILKPVYAAILMPISSISVVIFTTIASKWISRKL